ncbi:UDP-D-xylose:ribitol-5-phosphate beta1,4-xylosyltransferase-like isoform X2 [Cimex lectularius]|uniref:Uncharacterized protein n=1 Tax=Cimex lectularius TaxID=79782 RepID=A0A8I6TJA9_CIMLE|nr:UDP-D-xylose:ribitol-5-phosphate beta1,4-xylosyltransferase-like isoform X2 [Cimex lectularius]XP_024082191.1 UDP-D-xylose:ribitol-5-phosphate beta1,4-xylosyltransferase-like isoform X2 [Cimex lectularius]
MGPSIYKHCIGYVIFFVIILIYFTATNVEHISNEWNYLPPKRDIQIWAKAAIAEYLWFHILNGHTESFYNGFYNNGNITLNGLTFYYLSGPGYIQTTVPQTVEYLILILNGHTLEHVTNALNWLEYIPQLTSLKKLAVIVLGSENCEDNWITKYLKSKGGPIDVLFMVYDSPLIDNKEVYQWPLGVATYRHFPKYNATQVNLFKKRKYTCNFVGTVYKGSSREALRSILNHSSFKHNCLLVDRDVWPAKETKTSLNRYINILNSSDFTLCPTGANTECYRIYEAISLGSTPIVEDVMTPGKCVAPLRLLKKYNPPIIFIKDWSELNGTLYNKNKFKLKSHRIHLLKWKVNRIYKVTEQKIINNKIPG